MYKQTDRQEGRMKKTQRWTDSQMDEEGKRKKTGGTFCTRERERERERECTIIESHSYPPFHVCQTRKKFFTNLFFLFFQTTFFLLFLQTTLHCFILCKLKKNENIDLNIAESQPYLQIKKGNKIRLCYWKLNYSIEASLTRCPDLKSHIIHVM